MLGSVQPRLPARLACYAVILLAVGLAESAFGRVLSCQCGELRLWISDVWSEHNSQHLFDPYSFSHLLHGVIFFWLLALCGLRRELALVIGSLLEGIWEVLENSPLIIDRYRAVTMAQGYVGDSIVNSMGDLLSCLAGMELARRIGFRWSIALFVATEVTMLVLVRDCLLFNIIMLIYPLDWIRDWQLSAKPV